MGMDSTKTDKEWMAGLPTIVINFIAEAEHRLGDPSLVAGPDERALLELAVKRLKNLKQDLAKIAVVVDPCPAPSPSESESSSP